MGCARGRYKGSSDAAQSPGIESGRSNGVDGSAVGLATGSQPRPRLGDQVLEPTHRTLPANMLEDDQPASGCEHTPDLAKGRCHVIDRAQHKPDMDRVEAVVRERNRLGNPIDDVDHDAATPGTSRSHPPKRRLRLHGGNRRHRRRKKHQVGSRTDAYHQQPADRITHRLSAIPLIEQLAEDRRAESVHIRKQRIAARYVLPRSSRNGGYSSRINETYTATR
jgi:hypothetical protein